MFIKLDAASAVRYCHRVCIHALSKATCLAMKEAYVYVCCMQLEKHILVCTASCLYKMLAPVLWVYFP